MDRQEWQYSSSALRKLIREVFVAPREGTDVSDMCVYKFGIWFNPAFRMFHIWNGRSQNTICTIKLVGEDAVVRYREASFYADIIKRIEVPNRTMRYVPSLNLSRHRSQVRRALQRRTERSIASFLAEVRQRQDRATRSSRTGRSSRMSQGQYGLSIPLMQSPMSMGLTSDSMFGTSEVSVQVLTVTYDREFSPELQAQANSVVGELQRHGVTIPSPIHMNELMDMYTETRERHQRIQAEMRQSMFTRGMVADYSYSQEYNVDVETYMGRPLEQLATYMSSTASTSSALTENDLMNAVQALDEANVPRENWDRSAIERLMGIEDV